MIALKPEVLRCVACVTNDSAPAINGMMGLEGSGKPALSDAITPDGSPASMSAASCWPSTPNVNGDTIYIGLDLPAGSGDTMKLEFIAPTV